MLRTLSTLPGARGRRATFDQVIQRAQQLVAARPRFAQPATVHVDHLRREVAATLEGASGLDDVLGQCEAWLECLESGGHPDRVYQCLVRCAVAMHLDGLEPDHTWTDAQRVRCAGLQANACLNPLDIDLLHRLPSDDVEAVLSVALQQAADSADWSDPLLHHARLFVRLQCTDRAQDWAFASALRDGLLQVLVQQDVSGMDAVEVSRRARIEQDLDEGLLGQFGRALRTGDLQAAVVCVQRIQIVDEALALGLATDVMAAVKRELAQVGVSVEWTTIRTQDPGPRTR